MVGAGSALPPVERLHSSQGAEHRHVQLPPQPNAGGQIGVCPVQVDQVEVVIHLADTTCDRATIGQRFQTLGHGKQIGPTCIPGIFSNTQIGAWYSEEGFPLTPPLDGVPALQPVPDRWQTLRPWDDDDLVRLNLTNVRDELDLDDDDSTSGPVPTGPGGQPPGLKQQRYPRFRT